MIDDLLGCNRKNTITQGVVGFWQDIIIYLFSRTPEFQTL